MSKILIDEATVKLALDHSEPSILSPGWTLVRNEDIAALREALAEQPAQPQQKPVAWVMFRQDEDGLEPIMFGGPGTAPDPATLKDRFVLKDVWLSPPAQRTWVGLTAEDRVELWKKNSSIDSFVNATEAKLKEKNT